MPNPLTVLHTLAGTVLKGKGTVIGIALTVVGGLLTAVAGHKTAVPASTIGDSLVVAKDSLVAVAGDPFTAIEALVSLGKQAWPNMVVLLGLVTTIAGYFRKAGADAKAAGKI